MKVFKGNIWRFWHYLWWAGGGGKNILHTFIFTRLHYKGTKKTILLLPCKIFNSSFHEYFHNLLDINVSSMDKEPGLSVVCVLLAWATHQGIYCNATL